MEQVGESVDDRDGAGVGESLHLGVVKRPHHEAVDEARQHARGVGDSFAPAELDVAPAEKKRIAAQFVDADLEGDTGAGARLGKNHRPRLPRERLRSAPAACVLEFLRVRKDRRRLAQREVSLLEEMLHKMK